jgi:hypothetical protein
MPSGSAPPRRPTPGTLLLQSRPKANSRCWLVSDSHREKDLINMMDHCLGVRKAVGSDLITDLGVSL